MKNWRLRFFLLALGVFSQNAWCNETIEEAITRLYHPLASASQDIQMDERLSRALRRDLQLNQDLTPGGVSPWLNTNLLCRCQDEDFIAGEMLDSTPLNGGRVYVLMQLSLNKARVDAHRLLGLTLVRDRSSQRWQVEDIDDGAEIPKSLRRQIREDSQIKSKASDIESRHDLPHLDVSMTALLTQPEKYHLQKVRIEGVGNIEFEGNSVYLNKEAWKYRLDNSRLSLDIDFPNAVVTLARARQLNGDYVVIEGIFDMDWRWHGGLRSGGITHITRYEQITTRAENEQQRTQEIKQAEAAKLNAGKKTQ